MHVTIFRNRKRPGMDAAAYAADSERLVALAEAQPGFLAYRRYTGEDGESLSIAEWETEADARAWGRHPAHVAAQARGRADYYQSFTTYACADPAVRHFERPSA